MKRKPYRPPVPPASLVARATLERPAASLDADSLVALEWAAHAVHARHRTRPQPAVVIRRALQLYVQHLTDLDQDFTGELSMLTTCAKGSGTARSLTEARARMEAAEGRHLGFLEALWSPEKRKESRDMLAALEKHLEALQ